MSAVILVAHRLADFRPALHLTEEETGTEM